MEQGVNSPIVNCMKLVWLYAHIRYRARLRAHLTPASQYGCKIIHLHITLHNGDGVLGPN